MIALKIVLPIHLQTKIELKTPACVWQREDEK